MSTASSNEHRQKSLADTSSSSRRFPISFHRDHKAAKRIALMPEILADDPPPPSFQFSCDANNFVGADKEHGKRIAGQMKEERRRQLWRGEDGGDSRLNFSGNAIRTPIGISNGTLNGAHNGNNDVGRGSNSRPNNSGQHEENEEYFHAVATPVSEYGYATAVIAEPSNATNIDQRSLGVEGDEKGKNASIPIPCGLSRRTCCIVTTVFIAILLALTVVGGISFLLSSSGGGADVSQPGAQGGVGEDSTTNKNTGNSSTDIITNSSNGDGFETADLLASLSPSAAGDDTATTTPPQAPVAASPTYPTTIPSGLPIALDQPTIGSPFANPIVLNGTAPIPALLPTTQQSLVPSTSDVSTSSPMTKSPTVSPSAEPQTPRPTAETNPSPTPEPISRATPKPNPSPTPEPNSRETPKPNPSPTPEPI